MSMIKDIVSEKCPVCGEGHVFEKKGNPLLFKMPKMYNECRVCGHHFEKEPGYFFGAMYVSYALAVAEMFAAVAIAWIFTSDFKTIVAVIALMALLLSTFNFRLSRMLWIYMFDGGKRRQLQ